MSQQSLGLFEPESHPTITTSWENEYWDKALSFMGGELPYPTMVKGWFEKGKFVRSDTHRTPVYMGGLVPYGERYLDVDRTWVFTRGHGGGYYSVANVDLIPPTDAEYGKYFRKETNTFKYILDIRHSSKLRCDLVFVKRVGVTKAQNNTSKKGLY